MTAIRSPWSQQPTAPLRPTCNRLPCCCAAAPRSSSAGSWSRPGRPHRQRAAERAAAECWCARRWPHRQRRELCPAGRPGQQSLRRPPLRRAVPAGHHDGAAVCCADGRPSPGNRHGRHCQTAAPNFNHTVRTRRGKLVRLNLATSSSGSASQRRPAAPSAPPPLSGSERSTVSTLPEAWRAGACQSGCPEPHASGRRLRARTTSAVGS